MPCSKYKGRQRKACYATDGWKKPVKKAKTGAAKKPRVRRK